MKRRNLLKFFALSTGNIALPMPIFKLEGVHESAKQNKTAAKTTVTAQQIIYDIDYTELIFRVDNNLSYSKFHLNSPTRYVIDFHNSGIYGIDNLKGFANKLIAKIRVGHPRKNTARIVIDLNEQAITRTSFENDILGPYLKVTLIARSLANSNQDIHTAKQVPTTNNQPKIRTSQLEEPPKTTDNNDKIIVIDPGHGGIDPGTIGEAGTKEKDVVLAVAKRLQSQLNSISGYKAYLTRDDDSFLTLTKRVAIVQEHKANLSISLHVDAYHDKSIHGASVYCLNENGVLPIDPLIKMLIEKENSIRWGANSGNKQHLIDNSADWIQMDNMHRATLVNARAFGKKLLKSLAKNRQINLQYNRVKRADFYVLRTPSTPSALVEMGFLSNPNDERLIKDERYQNQISQALSQGVLRYLQHS
ncbi:MAG: N-acetylmuramoyl-L-alanine amidase [Magnetococcales bacterium]|nr:N-acetylmuramoyl-L-alanine amidase [Magnetococcales bacterium]